jgi:hypothetical protein
MLIHSLSNLILTNVTMFICHSLAHTPGGSSGGEASLQVIFIRAQNVFIESLSFKDVLLTRPVLDRFQDSSKTGSGINFFAAFLAAFCGTFFAVFLPTFFGLLLALF